MTWLKSMYTGFEPWSLAPLYNKLANQTSNRFLRSSLQNFGCNPICISYYSVLKSCACARADPHCKQTSIFSS